MASRIRSPPPSSYSPVSPSDTNSTLAKDGANSTRSTKSSFTFRPSGFRRVFGLLGKDSSKSSSLSPNPSGIRRGDAASTRRESESGVTRMPVSASTPGNNNERTNPTGGGGFLYRSRNARSMDALRIFSKSQIKPSPTPHNLSTVITPGDQSKNMDKDISPPVLRLQVDDEDEGSASQNSSTGGSTHRPSASSDIGSSKAAVPVKKEVAPKEPSRYSGIGGVPPPGAMGAVAIPATIVSPPSPPGAADSPQVTVPKSVFPTIKGTENAAKPTGNTSAVAVDPIPTRPRPLKPSLSIPIPPRIISHERAATAPAAGSPSSTSNSTSPTFGIHTIGPKSKVPPSPGLRLTPSIVMSRPVWPLPPLPNMDIPPVPPLPTSASSSNGNSASPVQTPKKTIFRLSPPARTRTLPLGRSATEGGNVPSLGRRTSERISRNMSMKLDTMPSLSVMGETEHGDPEADDDDMDDLEGEGDEMDGEGDDVEDVVVEEMNMPIGRPSIDSMISVDSVTSVETVRASGAEQRPLSTDSSLETPTPVNDVDPAENTKRKGKGKATQPANDEDDENAEHSDSDDSLYFDARASVIISPKDVPKILERRISQQQQKQQQQSLHEPGSRQSLQFPTAAARDQYIRDGSFARDRSSLPARTPGSTRNSLHEQLFERQKRDSTWSMSTARESVYYTPVEGQSTFLAPGLGFTPAQELFRNTSASAFAKEVAAKRASVPATFGTLPDANTVMKDGSLARRGGDSRFSMSRLGGQAMTSEKGGLPSVDVSTLGFDASRFSTGTLTPKAGAAHMDGLPSSRRDGLPNFDAVAPFTSVNNDNYAAIATDGIEMEARTPRTTDYFNDASLPARTGSAFNSPSIHIRRGSVSASVSVPAPIAEDLATVPATAEEESTLETKLAHSPSLHNGSTASRALRAASPPSAGIALPLDLSSVPTTSSPSKTNLTPLSSFPHPHTPISFPSPSGIHNRPSLIANAKRPSVYRQASRSMVELSLSSTMGEDSRTDDDYKGGLDSHITPSLSATTPVATTKSQASEDPLDWLVPPPSPTHARPANRQSTIRRVSSFPLLQSIDMPVSEKPPPAYHEVPRREEEGKEKLPRYSNDIILAGLLPRKMEFDRPGLQARDRSWKKFWCVLEGTMFRVYKVGTLEVKFGALAAAPVAGALPPTTATTVLTGGKVRGSHGSSFSVSNIARSIVTAPIAASGGDARPRSSSGAQVPNNSIKNPASPSWKAPLNDTSQSPDSVLTKNQQRLAPPSAGLSSPALSMNSGSSYAPSRSSFSGGSRPSTPQTRPTGGSTTSSHNSGNRSSDIPKPVGFGPGGRSLIDNGGQDIYTPSANHLLRKYTLQNAESGLATDYMKRRNVIRVRMEGEQFLLQLPGVEDVVEWIEGFQAAANISADLDVRPMPKGPLYPRRRRRRRNQRTTGDVNQASLSASAPTDLTNNNGSGTTPSASSAAVAATS